MAESSSPSSDETAEHLLMDLPLRALVLWTHRDMGQGKYNQRKQSGEEHVSGGQPDQGPNLD